jgi:hypothetical protein
MSSQPIVQTAYGPYRPLSARLPEFLAKYPPSEGYGVEISIKDTLCLTPDLRSFYELAIKSGQNFEALGLPSLKVKYQSVLVEACLLRNGVRLAVAHTFAQIHLDKDFEMAETRARQRLLAALGFDGKVLDDDELPPITIPTIEPADASASPVPSAEVQRDAVDAKVEPLVDSPETVAVTPIGAPGIKPHVAAQVRLKIQLLRDAGQPVEEPTSMKEAAAILRMTLPASAGATS